MSMHRTSRTATSIASRFPCPRTQALHLSARFSILRTRLAAPHASRLPIASRFHTGARMAAATDSLAAQTAEELNITPDTLSKTLQEKIGATYCAIEDMSGGCGQAFEAIIVSPQFEKKTSLARHRLVNGALKQEIAAIHAWTPKCFTPAEWEKKQTS